MENQSRNEELLSEALRKYDQMLEKHDMTNARLESIESRLGNVEMELFKLNLQTTSNTRALIDLVDKLPIIFEHEKRIVKLEGTVFK